MTKEHVERYLNQAGLNTTKEIERYLNQAGLRTSKEGVPLEVIEQGKELLERTAAIVRGATPLISKELKQVLQQMIIDTPFATARVSGTESQYLAKDICYLGMYTVMGEYGGNAAFSYWQVWFTRDQGRWVLMFNHIPFFPKPY